MKALLAAVAIVGGTVFTGDGPVLENATVIIDGNRIAAVGRGVDVPADARRIEAGGSTVTPGLVEPASRLGVEELSRGAPTSIEATAGPRFDPIRAALRVVDTFNPASIAIPIAREGGLTSAVVIPRGGVVSGQCIWADLVEEKPVRNQAVALYVSLRAGGDQPGSRARAFLRLREALEDARLYRANRGPYITRSLRELSVSPADLDVLERVLEGELKVVFEVDRAADIRTVLRLAREHQIDAILLGVEEGWMVADEIARTGVPAVVDPLANLPSGFDTLNSRSDNAVLLHRAGVRLALTTRGDPHLAHRLRFAAGNAVAEGLPYEVGLAAITRVPAESFGVVDAGVIRPGMLANLAIWNGDPLELTAWPTHLFIRGEEVELTSRQDLLTERYR